MMKRSQYIVYKIALAVFALFANVIAFAQGPPNGSPPTSPPTQTGPPCWDPACVPIDGGLGFLIAAGATLGVKKIYDHRKNKSRA